jgi:hypothetical protein
LLVYQGADVPLLLIGHFVLAQRNSWHKQIRTGALVKYSVEHYKEHYTTANEVNIHPFS